MESVTKLMDKDSPIQKTEITTSIEKSEENIQGGEGKSSEVDKGTEESVDTFETSRSDVQNKDRQNLEGDKTKLETSGQVSQVDDKFKKSSPTTFEEGEIVLDVLLDQQSEIHVETELVTNKSLDNHPYKDVLLNFEPGPEQLSFVESIEPPKSLLQTPLIDIDNKDDLEALINSLKSEKEIGVDVEWSDHGYEALTCLVQLSTKDKDYIIDAIALKKHLHALNDIFVNPNIVKIFHAASNDLKWLQEDFNIFVVNMFDTQRAMRALGCNKLGLDFALREYQVVKDNGMQRADFRKRPLPPKYKDYARTDSHFLIHMYKKLKNRLIETDLLVQVLDECKKDCEVVHEKVEDGPYVSVREDILKIHERQLVALQKLNQWRHRVARYADINTGVVLSKNNMKNLVLQLPDDAAAVLQISRSEHVKEHLQEILEILLEAKGMYSVKNKGPSFHKFGNRGRFSNKRKVDQTEFGGNDNFGGGSKRGRAFYRNDNSRGRGKGNTGRGKGDRQNDSFDLRNSLQKNTFNRNKNNKRFRM